MIDYTTIAQDFDKTRGYVWPCVKRFLESNNHKTDSSVLEAGCGNGRNLKYAQSLGYTDVAGFDICPEFVSICREKKGLNVFCGNILEPLSKKYDIIMAVAVIHHLETEGQRQRAIKNLIDGLNPGGKLMFSVWSYEKYSSKAQRHFELGDNYVPWHSRDGNTVVAQRYYYIYNESLIKDTLASIGVDYELYWEEQNWIVTIKN